MPAFEMNVTCRAYISAHNFIATMTDESVLFWEVSCGSLFDFERFCHITTALSEVQVIQLRYAAIF